MALRCSQEVKRREISPWKWMVGILIFILMINASINMLNHLSNARLAGYVSIGIIGITILINIKLINHYLTTYEYTLSHNKLSFNRSLGKRTREVIQVPLEDIHSIIALPRLKKDNCLKKKAAKRYKFEIGKVQDRSYYRGYFKANNKFHTFLFQPSDKMIEALVKELGEERIIR
ncbi:hypothetical protein NSA47_11165 [Irregularibacter muris]|uniref:Uncharacterized protein n=1 Tax=Irregularibacter muris TaxID=1796619 RepID=A0AAE3HG55_9FIRM|nr:hypothetical protein [Irregularibacter muris]MCR1899546.1 hypothetical protein [Irregularibacter muris]